MLSQTLRNGLQNCSGKSEVDRDGYFYVTFLYTMSTAAFTLEKDISAIDAAKILGISVEEVSTLEQQGILRATRKEGAVSFFSSENISKIKSHKGLTLSDEAEQVGVQLQRDIAASLAFVKKILLFAGGSVVGYLLLIVLFAVLFSFFPLQTANVLGYVAKSAIVLPQENKHSKVLAASTTTLPQDQTSFLQTILQPIGNASLAIVKYASPNAYNTVAKVSILDTNEVLTADANGNITPRRTITFPNSGLLQINDPGLIANLNSQFVQGKKPGSNPGDIAVMGANGTIEGLVIPTSAVVPTLPATPAVLVNPTSIPSPTPIIITNTNTILISTSSGTTVANTDTLADVTARGATTTTALTLSNIANNITAGTLNVSGGSINGASIGDTNPNTGVFTTINGLTLTNNGANTLTIAAGKTLTVNNSLTFSGIDGTTFSLPAVSDTLVGRTSTDTLTNKTIAAGNNVISGLTTSNFLSTNISQWVNNASYMTPSSTDTLTNKTIAAGSNTISGLTAAQVGLSNVENTALSTWAGSTNLNTIANQTVTLPRMANLAANSIIGNNTGSPATPLALTPSQVKTLLAIATGDVSGLGSIATQNANTISITGGSISGLTGLTVTSGTASLSASTFLNTTSGSPANSYDATTISVGSISATAQQNFSTLNIKNGGTGFLDLELLHGMLDMQGMNTFSDDFTGRSLDSTKWQNITTQGAGNTCSSTFVTGLVNGILQFTTSGTSGRGCALTTQATLTNGFYERGNNPIFETKVSLSNVTNARVYAGFTNTVVPFGGNTNANTQHAYIGLRSTDTQWQCITDDGGATDTFTSTGVTVVANIMYRLRVEVRNGTIPETICTVDDGTNVTRVTSTATQPGLANPMDIYIKAENGGGGAVVADWDYVRTWQDDPVGMVVDSTGNVTASPVVSDTLTVSPTIEPLSSPSAMPLSQDTQVSTDSAGLTNLVTNTINNILKNLVEFFGNVIFHADVSLLGHTTVSHDTAGHAVIKAGQSDVAITFDKEYSKVPVVTASINLVTKSEDVPQYAVYGTSTKGFSIMLAKPATYDVNFSWIALGIANDSIVVSSENTISITPTMPAPSLTILPEPTGTSSATITTK